MPSARRRTKSVSLKRPLARLWGLFEPIMVVVMRWAGTDNSHGNSVANIRFEHDGEVEQ